MPQEYASNVVDMLNRRKGDMLLMAPCEGSEGMTLLTFLVPTRGKVLFLSLNSSLYFVFLLEMWRQQQHTTRRIENSHFATLFRKVCLICLHFSTL